MTTEIKELRQLTRVPGQQLKTGKLPASHNPKDFQLAHLEDVHVFKPVPVGFVGYDTTLLTHDNWLMLANDRLGDCEIAESQHAVMALHSLVGSIPMFNDKTAIHDYEKIAGYDPKNPESDQGTDMHVSLSYRRHTGNIDVGGKHHKIGAYIALEAGNWTQLLEALSVFEVASIGFEFPYYAMDQFNAHKPWSVVSGAPEPAEGHAVLVVARPKSRSINVVTWGELQEMTNAFYAKYCDEAYVFVSSEDLVKGETKSGYNLSQLNELLKEL